VSVLREIRFAFAKAGVAWLLPAARMILLIATEMAASAAASNSSPPPYERLSQLPNM
jgi:hypothetical protein